MFCKAISGALAAVVLIFSSVSYAADQVDINSADAAALAQVLAGIGDAKAAAIVRYRQQHGPFTSADQLVDVKGIGSALVARNRDRILLKSESDN